MWGIDMSDISLVFTELFYGAGSWLGLLILLSIIVALTMKAKYAGVLMLPVTIFLGINYITYDTPLLWNGIIMFFASLFILINLTKGE